MVRVGKIRSAAHTCIECYVRDESATAATVPLVSFVSTSSRTFEKDHNTAKSRSYTHKNYLVGLGPALRCSHVVAVVTAQQDRFGAGDGHENMHSESRMLVNQLLGKS